MLELTLHYLRRKVPNHEIDSSQLSMGRVTCSTPHNAYQKVRRRSAKDSVPAERMSDIGFPYYRLQYKAWASKPRQVEWEKTEHLGPWRYHSDHDVLSNGKTFRCRLLHPASRSRARKSSGAARTELFAVPEAVTPIEKEALIYFPLGMLVWQFFLYRPNGEESSPKSRSDDSRSAPEKARSDYIQNAKEDAEFANRVKMSIWLAHG
ncbi:hypothetical protein J3459_017582 [Metarhizium acridum]|nr:hypothetical protein J3459_017582 [Metarhizium acridum]